MVNHHHLKSEKVALVSTLVAPVSFPWGLWHPVTLEKFSGLEEALLTEGSQVGRRTWKVIVHSMRDARWRLELSTWTASCVCVTLPPLGSACFTSGRSPACGEGPRDRRSATVVSSQQGSLDSVGGGRGEGGDADQEKWREVRRKGGIRCKITI